MGAGKAKYLLLAAILLLSASVSRAQFYTQGCESASVRWSHIRTAHYDVIYPRGLDSLARVFCSNLEWAAEAAGEGLPYNPAQLERRPHPVVLHPFAAYSNGMESWTPSYISLYTCPSAYDPNLTPWEKDLVLHESRHLAQSQYVLSPKYRWTHFLSGELIEGGLHALYCGPAFFEGDAVWAETELTQGGRGRCADFLEYVRAAFAEGDVRDYWQWRYGAFGKYSPDYYRAGYIVKDGITRYFDADFTHRYYERLLCGESLFPVDVWGKTVRESTGMSFREVWKALADSLAPAKKPSESPIKSSSESLSKTPAENPLETPEKTPFEDYSSFCFVGEEIFAVKEGIDHAAQLVKISPDGSEKVLRAFAGSQTSPLKALPDSSLVWSERVPGVLWSDMTASSDIFFYKDGRVRRLTRGGRFFNPSPCGDDILVSEYSVEGGTSLRLLEGGLVERMPDGVQVLESAAPGGRILYSALSRAGAGIYEVGGGLVAGPFRSHLKGLRAAGDSAVVFTLDLEGRDEGYILQSDGTIERITDTPFGARCPQIHGERVYSSNISAAGRFIEAAPLKSPEKSPSKSPEKTTRETPQTTPVTTPSKTPSLQAVEPEVPAIPDSLLAPKPYRRLAHAFRAHSWLPIYFDYDAVSSLSFESLAQAAGLGASVYSQNPLGTLWGMAGYKAEPTSAGWQHSGALRFSYNALPVTIEGSAEVSTAPTSYIYVADTVVSGSRYNMLKSETREGPSFSASLSAYVPLNFSSGGWYRGVIPQLSVAVSNSRLETTYLNRYSLSLRAYTVRPVAKDAIYPRWGVGGQIGYAGRVGTAEFYPPSAFALLYGYFPGFAPNQNFHFYAFGSSYAGSASGLFADPYVVSRPRGFESCDAVYSRMVRSSASARVYLEYGLPCVPLNSSLLGVFAYMRNLEVIPRVDAVAASFADGSTDVFASAGVLVNLVLGNILCVPYDTRVGVSFDLNGTSYAPAADCRYKIGFNFTVDI